MGKRRKRRIAEIAGVILFVAGLIGMIYPIKIYETTVDAALWDFIIPILISAGVSYIGTRLIIWSKAWWFN